jgi:hypothetical protein
MGILGRWETDSSRLNRSAGGFGGKEKERDESKDGLRVGERDLGELRYKTPTVVSPV